jgi:hypothetical protein
MDERPSSSHDRPRRLAILCGAALAAAFFTPVPATAFAAVQPLQPLRPGPMVSNVHTVAHTTSEPAGNALAATLIAAGMTGIALAAGGLVIVAVRRRQY